MDDDHHRYTGMLANASLLSSALDGSSCVEICSNSAAALHANCDARQSDHLHDDDDDDDDDDDEGHGLELVPSGEGEVLCGRDDGTLIEGQRLKRKKYRGPRSWKEKWQQLHPWAFVRTINDEERMFCSVCEEHGNTSTRNAFRKEGSSNFQPSALSTHANSSAHKNALLMQKAWAESGKICFTNNSREKVPAVTEYGVIANHMATMASKLSNMVTRDEFNAFKAEWRIMQRRKDARRINRCCALNDPLMPLSTLDGVIPENSPNSLAELLALPSEHVESLLIAYTLPVHGTVDAKLRRLKAYMGLGP